MNVTEIGALLVKGAKAAGAFIMGANVTTLVSAGIAVGVIAVAAYGVIKYVRDRKAAYTDEANKSVVDRSLQLNFQDVRNQKELHPLMQSVRKQMIKDLYPKKSQKKKRNSLLRKLAQKKRERGIYGPHNMYFTASPNTADPRETAAVNDELFWFAKNHKKFEEPVPTMAYDNQCLRRVWENTRPSWY